MFDSFIVCNELIELLENDSYDYAVDYIKMNIKFIRKPEELSLAYIICGFISDKLGNYRSAIEDFSKAISCEDDFKFSSERSKDISFCGRSNSKYNIGDFKGAIEDKRKAIRIREIESEDSISINLVFIDYKSIILRSLDFSNLDIKYQLLSKTALLKKSKYDLINDFKKVISTKRKEEIIFKLERLSDLKYTNGDFKASIRAIRRAEKYY